MLKIDLSTLAFYHKDIYNSKNLILPAMKKLQYNYPLISRKLVVGENKHQGGLELDFRAE
ncbi:hypothetical protein AOX59_08475 [Lentibacillus amyloliquefaciens]|uniref:Uncharacterized protein n=1 Tax=Lentibacillus amyloliquefaciens TaxID=1472767 RepID=A0A0U3W639_9BACI|nr:hypothetical protein AOX59_08475 [Lentibacillus amyloliquefaciens]